MQQRGSLNSLAKYASGVNLLCNQSGVGIAPVVGVDYKLNDHFNFAAKYEFKTQVRMKNESTVFEAHEIEAVNKYRDGEEVNEDSPALVTLGAQWSPISEVRINAGGHYYFDKQAEWYGNSQDKLDHNSYEILAGAEWDVTDRLTISAGGQLTRYGLTDDYMNDMSFVVNSYSIGFGANYQLRDNVMLKAAFFQTEYGNYERQQPTIDSFTRTNRVLGLGLEVNL
jgi:opacity protein-like surface antigen